MYFNYADYSQYYNDITESEFNSYRFKAEKAIDDNTTGIDGVAKLKLYFPEKVNDIEAVKVCACEIAHTIYSIDQSLSSDTTEGKAIASMSSGSESISYVNNANVYSVGASDIKSKRKILADICKEYLANVKDINGVNLLYMGEYHV